MASASAAAPTAAAAAAAATAAEERSQGEEALGDATESNVIVWLRPTGDAPILKQQRYKVGADERFSKIVDLLRERTRVESVFVYVKESFAPSLDQRIGVLAAAYGTEGGTKLTLCYATSPAWG